LISRSTNLREESDVDAVVEALNRAFHHLLHRALLAPCDHDAWWVGSLVGGQKCGRVGLPLWLLLLLCF
jgi:hypothetical protein